MTREALWDAWTFAVEAELTLEARRKPSRPVKVRASGSALPDLVRFFPYRTLGSAPHSFY